MALDKLNLHIKLHVQYDKQSDKSFLSYCVNKKYIWILLHSDN